MSQCAPSPSSQLAPPSAILLYATCTQLNQSRLQVRRRICLRDRVVLLPVDCLKNYLSQHAPVTTSPGLPYVKHDIRN
ncbi:hypothetical protein J6590_077738 [Homalodisca vitripennis]|nr:hypothetical protein J6590_077738 [Homalodisca vitripennis]